MSRRWFFFFLFLVGCTPEISPGNCEGCNVVVVSLTNIGADHLSMYGYERETAPAISSLAQESLVFERAYSPASWTLPAGVSFFTSQYPFEHRLMSRTSDQFGFSRVQIEVPTLFSYLQKRGYSTASFNGGQDYRARFRFGGGTWESFKRAFRGVGIWYSYGTFDLTVPAAIDWLRNNSDSSFFLHVQGYDAHCPFAYPTENLNFASNYSGNLDFTRCYYTYNRGDPVNIKGNDHFLAYSTGSVALYSLSPLDITHMNALYDGEIALADTQVGILLNELERLGLSQNTIVIIMSEHGDMLGKYGKFMRGGPIRASFYEDVLHVPLIFYHPRMEAARISHPVSLIDVAPTLLEMLGFERPETFRGSSLFSKHPVYAGSLFTPGSSNTLFNFTTVSFAVWQDQLKLIKELTISDEVTSLYELYDLRSDPEEAHALHLPFEVSRLEASLDHWLESDFGLTRFSIEGIQDSFSEE